MDFAELLGQAQLNQIDKTTNDRSKLLLKTKMSGPKKEKRDKGKIQPNVQKFLQKQAEDERRKKIEAKQKFNKLNELRTDRAKNKIVKHLKVTKSANKSVIEDAVDRKNTSVTLSGRRQCDEDDYGYESKTSACLYERLMSKYEADPDDPMAKFSKSGRARELKDMQGIKDRVKSSLRREEEDSQHPTRRRRKKKEGFEDDGFIDDSVGSKYKTGKVDYRKLTDKERKEEEARKKRIENSKKAPPPVDFNSLIRLAEVKKDIPVKIEKKVVAKEQEFGDRPMTKREKEEFMRDNQARLRREGKLPAKEKSPPIPRKSDKRSEERERVPEKPKIRAEPGPSFHSAVLKSMPPPERRKEDGEKSARERERRELEAQMRDLEKKKEELEKRQKVADYNMKKRAEHQRKLEEFKRKEHEKKQERKRYEQEKSALEDMHVKYKEMQRKMKEMESQMSMRNSRDIDSVASRPFPGEKRKSGGGEYRRRLDSDSEEDYDSEMDDFIDDSDAKCDYSAEIRKIFNYDKRKYQHEDDFDDRSMENNKFASIMMEEARSAKIGRREDLEDMRREEEEKKRKRRR